MRRVESRWSCRGRLAGRGRGRGGWCPHPPPKLGPCTIGGPCSRLYLAQGPQIVPRAPGPCVQTGWLLPSVSAPEAGHDPGSRQHRGGRGEEEEGGDGTVSSESTFTQHMNRVVTLRWSRSLKANERIPTPACRYLAATITEPTSLPRCVRVLRKLLGPFRFSFLQALEKGTAAPSNFSPTSALESKTTLVSLDRIDIQSKCQSSSSHF